jgi:hypothetical protein
MTRQQTPARGCRFCVDATARLQAQPVPGMGVGVPRA